MVVLRYIPNEDKTAELFKNLRLEIFASPCDILWAVLIYIPHEDKTVRLFKNLRLWQLWQLCVTTVTTLTTMKQIWWLWCLWWLWRLWRLLWLWWTWQYKTGLNSAMNDTDMLPGSYPPRKYMVCMLWSIILWRWEEVSPMRDDDNKVKIELLIQWKLEAEFRKNV